MPRVLAGDELAIDLAIEAARADDREVDDATARCIASQLHGGQASALYSLASTGNLTHERLEAELHELYQDHHPQIREWASVLGTYALHREHRGPVDGWHELWPDRPDSQAASQPGALDGDPEAEARQALFERINAAGVTTLGQLAIIVTADGVYSVGAREHDESAEADVYSWRDAARWRPDALDDLDTDGLDAVFTAVPDIELAGAEHIGSFRLLRHGVRPGGLVLTTTSTGQRRVWATNSDEDLTAYWRGLQHEHDAYAEATGWYLRAEVSDDRYDRPYGRPQPRIWLASLADYNNGRLHGEWLDATCDADTLQAASRFVLRGSAEPDAEEWGIFDYEGFGDLSLSEYESMETISRIAKGINEHGLAFSAWAEYVGTENHEELARFDDHYRGEWDDMEAYVKDVLDNIGLYHDLDEALKIIPEDLRQYIDIDTEALARDWEIEMHVVENPDVGMWIFDTRA